MIKVIKFNAFLVGHIYYIYNALSAINYLNNNQQIIKIDEHDNLINGFSAAGLNEVVDSFYVICLKDKYGIFNLKELLPSLKKHTAISWHPGGHNVSICIGNDKFTTKEKALEKLLLTDEIIEININEKNTYYNPLILFVYTVDNISSKKNITIEELNSSNKVYFNSNNYYNNHKSHFERKYHTNFESKFNGRIKFLNRNSDKTLIYWSEDPITYSLYNLHDYNIVSELHLIENQFDGNIIVLQYKPFDVGGVGIIGLPLIANNCNELSIFILNFISDYFPKTDRIYYFSFCNGAYGILPRLCGVTKSVIIPFRLEFYHLKPVISDLLKGNSVFKNWLNFHDFMLTCESNTKSTFLNTVSVPSHINQITEFFSNIKNDNILKNLEFYLGEPDLDAYNMANNFLKNKGKFKIKEYFV